MIRTEQVGSERAPSGALSPLRRVVASTSLIGAAAIHAAVAPAHLREWPAGGVFLLALAGNQALLAVIVGRRSARNARPLSVLVSAIAISAWVVSRTTGVPVGPHAGVAEAVGLADVSATLLEGLTIAVLIASTTGRVRTATVTGVFGIALCGGLVASVALGSPVLGRPDHQAPEMCTAPRAPSSYLDHSNHRDPLVFRGHERTEAVHPPCAP